MSQSIDQAFVKQYDREIKLAYQRMGSKFRGTVRTVNNVRGESFTFQKIGKGDATQKGRNSEIPAMSLDHTPVPCTLEDWFAADWIDRLDELKINHDERRAVVETAVAALGRRTDVQVVTQLDTGTQITATTAGKMTKAKFAEALELLGGKDVLELPGRRYAAVTWSSWTALMQLTEFTNSDYVRDHPLVNFTMPEHPRVWMGFITFPHSGLTGAGTASARNYFYHELALGHAIGDDVRTEISWENTRDSHFVKSAMSMNAALVDDEGVVRVLTDES